MRSLRLVPFLSGVVALWWMLGPAAAFAREDAEEKDDFGRTGFYIGVGGALTHLLMTVEDWFPKERWDSVDKSSFGVNGRVGYRFHTHFAAELEADWHSSFDGVTADGSMKVEPLVFTANMKGYLFPDRLQPYAVLGVGAMTAYRKSKSIAGVGASSSDWHTGFAARFGGGVDMYVTKHIVLNAEIRYVLPTGAVNGLDMISFGWALQYRF